MTKQFNLQVRPTIRGQFKVYLNGAYLGKVGTVADAKPLAEKVLGYEVEVLDVKPLS